MNRKIHLLVCLALFLSSSWSIAQESKVRVVVDRARIYAEASIESYRIETIKKGTVLTLFGAGQAKEDWLYVHYLSPRWNSEVTGFIQTEMVEEYSTGKELGEESRQELEQKPEAKQNEKKETKQVALGLTSPPSKKSFPFPLSFSVEKNPRIFEIVEPPEQEISVTEKVEETAVLPERKKPIVKPKDKINTKVWEEQVVIPGTTEVSEKERDIKKLDLPEKKEQPEEREPQIVEQKPPKITRSMPPRDRSLFTFSLGYGPSLGGLGGFIQLNTSGNFSVHWGIGYYPTSLFFPDYDWVEGKVLYSVGVKYYLPWRTDLVRPYIDLQYGGLSVEAVRIVTGIWYYTYIYEDIQKTLWGPSLLAGIELRMGSFGLNGAVGASYVLTKWEYWDQPLFVSADIGFILYF